MLEKTTQLNIVKRKLHVTNTMLATRLRVSLSAVCKWNNNNGIIPNKYHDLIIAWAIERGFKLTIAELVGE